MTLCMKCGNRCLYNKQYDAYYCRRCNKWSEQKCSDPHCQFCTKRPARPSQVRK